jgi:hypothetical protein
MANGLSTAASQRVDGADFDTDFDAPTEMFPRAVIAETPKPRSCPWPPSPRPRSATAPTVRIRLADLRSSDGAGAGSSSGEAAGPSVESVAAAASIELSRTLNARTLVLAVMATVVVLCGGALFVGPLGAVSIAPDAGPGSAAVHTPRISRASVVPAALLARTPDSGYPASIERLDAPKVAPAVKPSAPAAKPSAPAVKATPAVKPSVPAARPSAPAAAGAAMPGIPGMMGTPVPVSTPGRAGTQSSAHAVTALSTAAH